MRARRLAWIAAAALCAAPGATSAHTAGTIGFATVTVAGERVRYELALGVQAVPEAMQRVWGLDLVPPTLGGSAVQATIARHIQVSIPAGACRVVDSPPPALKAANIVVTLAFECPAAVEALVIRDDLTDVLGADHHTLANVHWPGGTTQIMFQPDRREARVMVGQARPQGVGGFFTLGVEHILIGFDHLLFLLALVLRGGNAWSLLKIITAFTIAHSITLALAALNVIVLPARLVEGAIALSIAYVAAENLFAKQAASHRWAVSFVFGLVHGIGFSSVLREIGLPRGNLLWPLLGFNLGVEAGQAVAVLAVLPLLAYLRRTRHEARTIMAVSVVVLVAGLALFVDRALLGAA